MSVQDLTDFYPLAIRIAEAEGRNPDFLVVAEMAWDYLEERGFDPSLFSDTELDEINDYVYDLTKEVYDNG